MTTTEKVSETALLEALAEAVVEALGDAAFVFVEPAGGDTPAWPDGPLLEAELELGTERARRVVLLTSLDLCVELAANMLGVDCDSPAARSLARDALAETANLVAGHVVQSCWAEELTVGIGVPTVRSMSVEDIASRSQEEIEVTVRTDLDQWLVAALS